jgi:hypothetical protein
MKKEPEIAISMVPQAKGPLNPPNRRIVLCGYTAETAQIKE